MSRLGPAFSLLRTIMKDSSNDRLHYCNALLTAANNMISDGSYELAIVISQMACEIYSEQTLSDVFKYRKFDFLESAIDDLLPSYNLANDKVRRLYVAMTGNPIHQEFFWHEYKKMVSLRNKVIHGGCHVSKAQAEEACRTAKHFVKHLSRVLETL